MERNRPSYLLLRRVFFIEEKIEKLSYENSMNEINRNESILLI